MIASKMIPATLALSIALAGCLGGGGDDANLEETTIGSAADDGNDTFNEPQPPEPEPFEPETHTWDGVIPIHACVDWNCVASPVPEADDSNTFEVSEGATLALFNFTWERGAPELIVDVGGDPTVEEIEHPGAWPAFQFEVPLDDSGTLEVSVQVADESGNYLQGYDTEFHLELTVS